MSDHPTALGGTCSARFDPLRENRPKELRPLLKAKGWPTHRLKDDFEPRRFYNWIERLTQDYRKETGRRIPQNSEGQIWKSS